jgi:hypothetical protein
MELQFLQAQIKPHFIFNSLSVISSLSIREPERAKALVLDLSDFLRISFDLDSPEGLTTIKKKLELVQAYLAIEQARFKQRLAVEFMIEEGLDCTIPMLFNPTPSGKCRSAWDYAHEEGWERHLYLMDSPVMSDMDKKYFHRVSMEEGSEADYFSSIKKLTEFLTKHYGKKTIILIDEYDAPIQQAYLKKYYDPLISFMRNFMTVALKDNNYLEKAVLTGVMRVARESLFSGLNNLSVWTLLDEPYCKQFGFLETEVEELLTYYGIESQLEEVRNWYNGYMFGNTVIYNPWSLLKYAQNWKGGLQPYWVNTSDNEIVHRLISRGGPALKMELEDLLQGTIVVKTINQNISMGEAEKNDQNVWSFLLFSGYLKPINREIIDGEMICGLAIPNREVQTIYRDIVKSWFNDTVHSDFLRTMLKSLTSGQIEVFASHFREYVQSSFSYFDIGGKVPEKIYHAFVLGLLVGLRPNYEIKSNREGGYGRYDAMVIPQDKSQAGIIIEFKSVAQEVKDLEQIAQLALQQIEAKGYQRELFERGIYKIIKLGIVFQGKTVLVKAGG